MKKTIFTLYLDANSYGWKIVLFDTVLRGIFGYRDGDRPPQLLRRVPGVANLFSWLRDLYSPLSYIGDWREAFLESPDLNVEVCNINNLVHYGRCLRNIRNYDLIIVSHAATGDDMTVLQRTRHWFRGRNAKMAVFIGNEYDYFADKIDFIRAVGADYICGQLPHEASSYLYEGCDGSEIIDMPHALNPKVYNLLPEGRREVDVGFIGDIYKPFIGDRERTDLIEWFEAEGAGHGLFCDIRRQRVARSDWNIFLNRCHGIIGAESGTYYLNDHGKLLERAKNYNLFENPEASFSDVLDMFYKDKPRNVSGKCISSRHFEPIGTKTCQLLLEGNYNGILKPDVHYIEIKRDMSNIQDAIARFKDESRRGRMVEETYDYVMTSHTYAHRVAQLVRHVS